MFWKSCARNSESCPETVWGPTWCNVWAQKKDTALKQPTAASLKCYRAGTSAVSAAQASSGSFRVSYSASEDEYLVKIGLATWNEGCKLISARPSLSLWHWGIINCNVLILKYTLFFLSGCGGEKCRSVGHERNSLMRCFFRLLFNEERWSNKRGSSTMRRASSLIIQIPNANKLPGRNEFK